MIIIAATLLAFSVGGIAWAFISERHSHQTVSQRLSNVFTKSGKMEDKEADSQNRRDFITLDESYKNTIARKLYVAGMRKSSQIAFFIFLRNISLLIPVILLVLFSFMGQLNSSNLIRSLLSGIAAYFGMFFFTTILVNKRKIIILKSMPQFFDLLVVALEAGIHFASALPRILKELDPKDPLTQEFELLHHEFLMGLSFAEVCDRLARRCEVHDLSVILNALIESDRLGSSLAPALRIQADELRDKIKQRAREKAHKIPVKMLGPMVLIFGAMMMFIMGPLGHKLGNSMKEFDSKKPKKELSGDKDPAKKPNIKTVKNAAK